MKKKYIYIIVDTDDNLVSHRSAFLSEHDALDYAVQLNNLRLANGMYPFNFQIIKLCIERPKKNVALSENL